MTGPALIVWERILDEIEAPRERYPVRNHEPRVQMGGRKWHLIHERDGGRCWMCHDIVVKGSGEVDHLVPRSSFEIADLPLADRSDNLRTSCGPCNQAKSNWTHPEAPATEGVTDKCWECLHDAGFDPEMEPDQWQEHREAHPYPTMRATAYCGHCGFTSVPDESWLM